MNTDNVETVDMDVAAPTRNPLRLMVDHNPFFLLSGVCMLVGCFLINAAAHQEQDRLGLLLGLLGVFNLYEVLVIALGLYLLRGRGLVRDAGYLLLLEMLLLVDATLLYNECFTARLSAGAIVASVGLVLAVAKAAVIAHYVDLRLTRSAWSLIALNLAAIFAMPGILRALGEAELLTAGVFYTAWWIAGGLLAAHALPSRWWTAATSCPGGEAGLRRVVGLAISVLPILSVVGHLRAAHYIYSEPVLWCDYAPLVLGVSMVAIRYAGAQVMPATLRGLVVIGGAIAAAMSMGASPALTLTIGEWDWLTVSPMRLTLVAAAGVYLWLWWRMGGQWVVAAAATYLLIALAGPTPQLVRHNLSRLFDWIESMAGRAAPTTTMQWGIVAVVAAFVFLVIGAMVSLVRRPPTGAAP